MTIGPVQLIALGFNDPEFHGEIIAELERLREAGRTRDRLVGRLQRQHGEIEVEHLSNLSEDEAIEVGSKVRALIGLGIEGEEGMAAGAVAGAEAAADGINVFSDEDAWDVLEDIPNDSAAALILLEHHWAIPLRDTIMPHGRIPHQRRVHKPARSGRDRAGVGRGGQGTARRGDSPHRRRAINRFATATNSEVRDDGITQGRTPNRAAHRPPCLTSPKVA